MNDCHRSHDEVQSIPLDYIQQINDTINQSNNILDLVFIITMEIHRTIHPCNDLSDCSFNFRMGNYRDINEFLGNFEWNRCSTNN